MSVTGGCYCGSLKYKADVDPVMMAQCHCRECQYISGGGANYIAAIPKAAFSYTQGEPAKFSRDDLEAPVVREFCAKCGTSIASLPPSMPDMVMVKVGTLDDPSVFNPQMAIFTCDQQHFHHIPEGVPSFDKVPG